MNTLLIEKWPSEENGTLIGWRCYLRLFMQRLDYAHVAEEICACKIAETFSEPWKSMMAMKMGEYRDRFRCVRI